MTGSPDDRERQHVPQAVHDCINDVWQEVVPLVGAHLAGGHNLADLTLVVEGQVPTDQHEALRARHCLVRGTTAAGVAMRTAAAEGLLRENPPAAERVNTRLPDDHLYVVVLLGGNCYVLTPKFDPAVFRAPRLARPRGCPRGSF